MSQLKVTSARCSSCWAVFWFVPRPRTASRNTRRRPRRPASTATSMRKAKPKELNDAGKYYPGAQEPGRLPGEEVGQSEGGGVESSMMQTVQLSIADGVYAAAVREALARSCAWHVESVESPGPVAALRAGAGSKPRLARLPLPLSNPERVVLITRKDPQIAGRGLGSRHRVRGVAKQTPSARSCWPSWRRRCVSQNPRNSLSSGISPNRGTARCANTPTKSDIPDPNVAKSQ